MQGLAAELKKHGLQSNLPQASLDNLDERMRRLFKQSNNDAQVFQARLKELAELKKEVEDLKRMAAKKQEESKSELMKKEDECKSRLRDKEHECENQLNGKQGEIDDLAENIDDLMQTVSEKEAEILKLSGTTTQPPAATDQQLADEKAKTKTAQKQLSEANRENARLRKKLDAVERDKQNLQAQLDDPGLHKDCAPADEVLTQAEQDKMVKDMEERIRKVKADRKEKLASCEEELRETKDSLHETQDKLQEADEKLKKADERWEEVLEVWQEDQSKIKQHAELEGITQGVLELDVLRSSRDARSLVPLIRQLQRNADSPEVQNLLTRIKVLLDDDIKVASRPTTEEFSIAAKFRRCRNNHLAFNKVLVELFQFLDTMQLDAKDLRKSEAELKKSLDDAKSKCDAEKKNLSETHQAVLAAEKKGWTTEKDLLSQHKRATDREHERIKNDLTAQLKECREAKAHADKNLASTEHWYTMSTQEGLSKSAEIVTKNNEIERLGNQVRNLKSDGERAIGLERDIELVKKELDDCKTVGKETESKLEAETKRRTAAEAQVNTLQGTADQRATIETELEKVRQEGFEVKERLKSEKLDAEQKLRDCNSGRKDTEIKSLQQQLGVLQVIERDLRPKANETERLRTENLRIEQKREQERQKLQNSIEAAEKHAENLQRQIAACHAEKEAEIEKKWETEGENSQLRDQVNRWRKVVLVYLMGHPQWEAIHAAFGDLEEEFSKEAEISNIELDRDVARETLTKVIDFKSAARYEGDGMHMFLELWGLLKHPNITPDYLTTEDVIHNLHRCHGDDISFGLALLEVGLVAQSQMTNPSPSNWDDDSCLAWLRALDILCTFYNGHRGRLANLAGMMRMMDMRGGRSSRIVDALFQAVLSKLTDARPVWHSTVIVDVARQNGCIFENGVHQIVPDGDRLVYVRAGQGEDQISILSDFGLDRADQGFNLVINNPMEGFSWKMLIDCLNDHGMRGRMERLLGPALKRLWGNDNVGFRALPPYEGGRPEE